MIKDPTIIMTPVSFITKIKKMQYRRQLPAIGVVFLGIVLPYWFPGAGFLFYPALVIAIAGVIWYMWIWGNFRFNNKIPVPPADDVLSPIEGKLKFVRRSQDITLINITKSFLDVVEIRSPHTRTILEDEMLKLHLDMGTITFRFNTEHIHWLDEPDFASGNIIGMIHGPATCTITLPAGMETALQTPHLIHAGITMITTVKGEPRSITIG